MSEKPYNHLAGANTAFLVEDTMVYFHKTPAKEFAKVRFGTLHPISSHDIGPTRARAMTWISIYLVGGYTESERRREYFSLPTIIYLGSNLTITRGQIIEYFSTPKRRWRPRYVIENEFNPGHYRVSLTQAPATAADSTFCRGDLLVLE